MSEGFGSSLPKWVNRHAALFSLSFGLLAVIFFIATSPLSSQQPMAGFLATPTNILPPTNLGDKAVNVSGATQSTLTWSPSQGAVSYNIYCNNVKVTGGITTTSYLVPQQGPGIYPDCSWYMTAIDAQGNES